MNFGSDIPTHTSLGRWVINVIATSITKSNQCASSDNIEHDNIYNDNIENELIIIDFEWNYNLVINYFKDILINKSNNNNKKNIEQGITLACKTGALYIVTVIEDFGNIYLYISY